MSRIRTLGVAALVMALAVAASSARAADETKKSDSASIHGVVTAITVDAANKDVGTFTVKPEAKKSKDAAAAAAPAEAVTFTVTKETKFAKVAHKKKGDAAAAAADDKGEAATFADLKEGDIAVVEADKDGKTALSVKFHTPGKKKPAA
jgi:hypothetical protein